MKLDFNHNSNLFSFVWHYLASKKSYLYGFFFVSLLWAIEMSLSPYLLGKIINIVALDSADKQQVLVAITLPAVLYVSMSFIINLNFRFFNYLCLKLFPQIKAQVVTDMTDYLMGHSYSFFQNNFTGTLTKKIQDMASGIEQLIQIPNEWFYPRLLALGIACVTLYFSVSAVFALILLLWGFSFVAITYWASKSSAGYANDLSHAEANLGGSLSDAIGNILTTKLFANVGAEINRNQVYIEQVKKNDRRLQKHNILVFFIQGLGVTVLIACMMAALIYGYLHQQVTPGDFALVLSLSISFTMGVFSLGEQILRFSKVIGTCQQALSFMQLPHDITDKASATELSLKQAGIEFNRISFAYVNSNPLFEKLTLKVQAGEKLGLVGFSGGGKSTLIKLLLRLIEPQQGNILIDDQDIASVSKNSLRRHIATIPQETELFHRSIIDNIRIARFDASDEEVIAAAKKARCHQFISALPEQYQSLVGERGVKLSGGQRQRIAIARAFLKDAPILILDEATSSLDSITEHAIQKSLSEVMQGRTTIVIAHRLSTLKDMDKIVVFESGKIVEQGVAQSLLNDDNSTFKKLWDMQSESFIL